MNLTLAYLGRSHLATDGARQKLRLAPNLRREPVSFDAELRNPLEFREAISALHDVVISDLRFKRRDKSAYIAWKQDQQRKTQQARQEQLQAARQRVLAAQNVAVPADLERSYGTAVKQYWKARLAYSTYLQKHDAALWRKLMPCDPVITVADDVVFFECFSADESSYGCLTVNREECFGPCDNMALGTTNVDYSWDLHDHFQSLRSYRPTRFLLDPMGFGVAVAEHAAYREEKIDLPPAWLRGFMQIQAAMTLPATKVTLSREAVYSILAWHKRRRAWKSPRAIRFELVPDRPPQIVLEPWETRITSHATVYKGEGVEPIRIWGARRLLTLARLLPLVERVDVYLLGTGLPSFWVAHLGPMRLTLGLSGWTTNDWTRSTALELLARPAMPTADLLEYASSILKGRGAATFDQIARATAGDAAHVAGALRHLAYSGQAIFDLHAGVYRWRQIMPRVVGESEMGDENPELLAARQLLERERFGIESRQVVEGVGELIAGRVESTPVELLIDGDGRIKRGKCVCGYFRRFGLKNGPCRHMLALRWMKPAADKGRAATRSGPTL